MRPRADHQNLRRNCSIEFVSSLPLGRSRILMQAGSESDSDSSDIDITRSLQRQEPAGAVFRPGMQVTAGRVDTGMAQRCLHKMDGSPAVERVRGVCMPEPM